jgi:hypothetical protein
MAGGASVGYPHGTSLAWRKCAACIQLFHSLKSISRRRCIAGRFKADHLRPPQQATSVHLDQHAFVNPYPRGPGNGNVETYPRAPESGLTLDHDLAAT